MTASSSIYNDSHPCLSGQRSKDDSGCESRGRQASRGCLSLWLLGFCSIITLGTAESTCNFPESFRGHWYQNGLGDVVIRQNTFQTKGKCLEQKNDLFFIENTEKNCKHCLLIIQRHHNVIQYKESFCMNYKSLSKAKEDIKAEDNFFTLVREGDDVHTPCPFQVNYLFSYSNSSTEQCQQPKSQMKACASPTKLHFRFRQCQAIPNTFDRDLEFYCLAHWKDGYDEYVYGRFSGTGMVKRDDMYRCFMYQEHGSELFISMSADANCWGMTSPQDGLLTLQLAQDDNYSLDLECNFPDWLRGEDWFDLADTYSYTVHSSDSHTVLRKRHKHAHTEEKRNSMALQCAEIHETDEDTFIFTSLVSKGCSSYFQCVKILRLQDKVLDLYTGTQTYSTRPTSCMEDLAATNKTHNRYTRTILMGEHDDMMACPIEGRYNMRSELEADCTRQVDIGCNSSNSISISSSYNCQSHGVVAMKCLRHWTDGGDTTYMLVGPQQQQSLPANCLVLEAESHGKPFRIKTDTGCNSGADDLLGHPISLTQTSQQEACWVTEEDISAASQTKSFLCAHASWWCGLVVMVTLLLR